VRMMGASDIRASARPFAGPHQGATRPVLLQMGYQNFTLYPDEATELARQLVAAVEALKAENLRGVSDVG
jgi:hypothetical protein